MDVELREQLRSMFRSGWFLEQARIGLRGVDLDTPPSWLDEELREALNAIPGPHERKKRTTVLRVAASMASGVPIRRVFEAKDTCDRAIWYGRKLPEPKEGWKDVPEIEVALDMAREKAHRFYDDLEEERLAARRFVLMDTEDRLAEISPAAVEVLLDIMTDPEAASDVRRKAAVDALTHAAPETAPKRQGDDTVHLIVDTSGPSMRDIRKRARRLPGRTIDVDGAPREEPALELVADGEEDGPPPPPPGGLRVPNRGLYEAPPTIASGNGHGEESESE